MNRLKGILFSIAIQCFANSLWAQFKTSDLINADDILRHTPTSDEQRLILSEINIDTTALNQIVALKGSKGDVPVAVVKNRIINLFLLMRKIRFSEPLPWTDKTLYDWFRNSCRKVIVVPTSGNSHAQLGGERFMTITLPPNSNLLWTDEWIARNSVVGLAMSISLLVHEARHCEGFPHTAGSNDATLEELGSWGVQYYLQLWLADKSNITTNTSKEHVIKALHRSSEGLKNGRFGRQPITDGKRLEGLHANGSDAATRTWKSNDGKSIEAKFVRIEGESVVIEMKNQTYTVPFSKLDSSSVKLAKELGSKK